ncbi:E3 SUMO-protein ligase SIZ1 [Musa acuminata AAA Group]|uniref:E3 SUMO-protein ligase SIZ1 n=1 Tax=Musa acuminata subsp. malaccensis TaxID=214687 RepID=A0A804KFV4_MUSAM|nr:PREDICTED: E3 SUMO-protein ligase SIZ1-like [Musa acuminata subsp. malaccensis]CAG1834169.1 unnamed protein product [Musa acuminata subsp. malaccensis]
MDLVTSCRDKLAYFRIKELKDVLTQLGLAKQGKKQDLVNRILQLLSDEQVPKSQVWGKKNPFWKDEVAKIIDDTYRKMQVSGATDLASKSTSTTDFNQVKPKEEIDDYCLEMKVRCLCGSSLTSDSIIQCEDPRCRVWQHIGCVIMPEGTLEGASPELPPRFYCEICRIKRADPFWITIGHPLLPIKLTSSGVTADGTSTSQNVERTFQLSRAHRESLQRAEYDLQVWCLLLNDKVPFRMQWPQFAELQVNGDAVRVVTRQGSQLLGINGRDDGPVVTTCSKEGINKICLSWHDARVFCLGIRLAKRRSIQQVLGLVPKEGDGERFEDALARVCRCIGGGAATENADSDSDLEVVANSVTISLRCPMSGSRMRIAGRFKPCVHMGCFDLQTFVELNQRSRKWQCPICLKNYSLENIIVDPYFNCITSLLQNCGEDVNEIDVKPDGCWRVRNENEFNDLSKWHMPDGSLCVNTCTEVKPDLEKLKQIKQEDTSEVHRSLKLKRNRKGLWEFSKPDSTSLQSSQNHDFNKLEGHCQIMPMSSSASGSYRDVEDLIVNQEAAGCSGLSLNRRHEPSSPGLNIESTYAVGNTFHSSPRNSPDVIVLSDSDEDNPSLISPETTYDTRAIVDSEIPFPSPPRGSEGFPESTALGMRTSGSILLDNNTDDFAMPLWHIHASPQAGPGFQLFGANAEVQDPLVDSDNSLGCVLTDVYGLASNVGLGDTSRMQNRSTCHSSTELHESLVDNPLPFCSDDPSLQIFLPSQPTGIPLQDDLDDRPEVPNGVTSDDWISLTLAGGDGGSAPSTRPRSGQQHTPKESRMEPLDGAASLLLSMNDNRADKVNSKNKRSDHPFSHPRQRRSARPRLHLSINTDSD